RRVSADRASADGTVLTFRVGGRRLAAAADQVAEGIRQPRPPPVPHSPIGLAGVANVRGRVAPVISLARLLGEPETGAGRVIVLERADPLGLAVDEISALG